MSLFEWMGELFSRGSYGTVEFGPEREEREPPYLVLLKFVLSATLIVLIDGLVHAVHLSGRMGVCLKTTSAPAAR